MNLSDGYDESNRAESGLSEAVAAPFGPSVQTRNDVGEGDTILGRRVEADILGQPARNLRRIWGENGGSQ